MGLLTLTLPLLWVTMGAVNPTYRADLRLAKRAAQGDAAAWEEIDAALRPMLTKLMRKFVGTQDAEDLVQDAMLHLVRKVKLYRGRSRFSTWAYRCSINVALMKLRRKHLDTISLNDVDEDMDGIAEFSLPTDDLHLNNSDLRVRLQSALDQLPPDERDYLLAHDVEGYDHRELLHLLDGGETGREKLRRAREGMRERLQTK